MFLQLIHLIHFVVEFSRVNYTMKPESLIFRKSLSSVSVIVSLSFKQYRVVQFIIQKVFGNVGIKIASRIEKTLQKLANILKCYRALPNEKTLLIIFHLQNLRKSFHTILKQWRTLNCINGNKFVDF